jgi:hypothetical protein
MHWRSLVARENDELLAETTVVEGDEVSRDEVSRTHLSSPRSTPIDGRYQIATKPRGRFPLAAERAAVTLDALDPEPSARRRLADGSATDLYRIWTPSDAGAREVSIRRSRPPTEADVDAITAFLGRKRHR